MNTVQLYDNVPMEGKEFEVLESRGVEKALRQCQDEKYDALFVPQLADARIAASGDSRVWNTWYSTPSLRATGRTKGNKPVVVYAHVPNYFSKPTNIAKAVDDGLVKYAGRMPPKEFQMLLDLEDNENVFVVDYDKLKNSSSGVIDVAQALKHPQTIPFLGGQTRAEQYLQRHREVRGNTIGIWHYDDLADKPLGRLLFLGYYDGALFGYIGLYDYGRFVGVAPEARASRKKSGPYREPGMVQGPSLDDLLALAEEHVSPAGKPGYEEAVRKLFGK